MWVVSIIRPVHIKIGRVGSMSNSMTSVVEYQCWVFLTKSDQV